MTFQYCHYIATSIAEESFSNYKCNNKNQKFDRLHTLVEIGQNVTILIATTCNY
jgi:hypothetical protein